MPVETGETRICRRNEFPRNQAPGQAEKITFPLQGSFAPISGLSGRVAMQPAGVTIMSDNSLVRPTNYAEQRRCRTEHISATLPFIVDYRDGTSYAAWKVWSGSTTKDTRFVPMPKKAAIRVYHKVVEWNRRGKLAGCHGGLIGSHVLLVLHTLIFDFLNHATGRLDPSYSAIQRRTRLCRQTVAKALARLKQLGIINWIRRCREDRDADGRFALRQETNAYAILPPTQWRGYVDTVIPEPPHPATWGACPPLPSLVEQAATDARGGDSVASIVGRLDADPGDTLASRLASLGRALGIN
jgi:hypothetical protein